MPLPDRARIDPPLPERGLPGRPAAASNVLELSVGELSGALKRTIEDRFGFVRVRGEISNYRGPHSSGHAYFSLKDEAARIDAVIWRTALARLKVKPQDGLEVVATGRVTTFPGKSTYQIVVETIEPAGVGALMALLDQRRRMFAAEGLFAVERKRPIPFLPRRIGIVTSPTGAVIRDILHRLADRFPRHVLVWPVRVQGETAADEVAAAIAGFDALPAGGPVPRPDLVIVARGGGSLEDLWAFNEEVVVRAAAACALPLIAAIGHETDTTLIDLVADLRAPTPSGAAEKAVPVRQELLAATQDLGRRHRGALNRHLERARSNLRALVRALPTADGLLIPPRQRLDRADERLAAAATALLGRRHLDVARLATRLSRQAPRTRLAAVAHRLEMLESRLAAAVERATERRRDDTLERGRRLARAASLLAREFRQQQERSDRIGVALARAIRDDLSEARSRADRLAQLLNTLGYRQVLARGFALVRSGDGRPVRRLGEVPTGTTLLDIEFTDGHMEVATAGSMPPKRGKARAQIDQASLF